MLDDHRERKNIIKLVGARLALAHEGEFTMKSYSRSDRISNQIKRELSEIIQRNQIKDDRLGGMISITNVIVSGDLRNVKVFFSVFGEEAQKIGTLAALEHATPFLRGELCRRVGLRFAPEVVFKLDDSLEQGHNVIELLEKIKRNEV